MAEQKKLYGRRRETRPEPKPMGQNSATERAKAIAFTPKTELGRKVLAGEITSLKEVFARGFKIKEAAITDKLIPNLFSDYILIGQSHGKFGGGKRRLIKQTQKKTAEGNKPHFATIVVVGNMNGYVGVGKGKAQESMPAKEKAMRNAKLNLVEVSRGCGSWKCGCGEPHSLPYKIEGKCGTVEVKLMPAPKGTGLVCEDEIKKLLKAAGFKDVWSKSWGQTRHKGNFLLAAFEALKKGAAMRTKDYKTYRGTI